MARRQVRNAFRIVAVAIVATLGFTALKQIQADYATSYKLAANSTGRTSDVFNSIATGVLAPFSVPSRYWNCQATPNADSVTFDITYGALLARATAASIVSVFTSTYAASRGDGVRSEKAKRPGYVGTPVPYPKPVTC